MAVAADRLIKPKKRSGLARTGSVVTFGRSFMKVVIRNLLAVIVGIAIGAATIPLLEIINLQLHHVDSRDTVATEAHMAARPASSLALLLVGYLGGFTLGVFVATRLSLNMHARQGTLVAAFFGAMSVMALRNAASPWWFWLGNFAVLFAALWFGIRCGMPKGKV